MARICLYLLHFEQVFKYNKICVEVQWFRSPTTRRAKVDAVASTLKELQDDADASEVFQHLSDEQNRFQVELPSEDACFIRLVLLDLMPLERDAVLHVVDCDILLSAAGFIGEGQKVNAT